MKVHNEALIPTYITKSAFSMNIIVAMIAIPLVHIYAYIHCIVLAHSPTWYSLLSTHQYHYEHSYQSTNGDNSD